MAISLVSSVWVDSSTDGERLVKKRVSEHASTNIRTIRELRGLAQVSDADKVRPRVVEALGTAEKLQRQLESLRDD